MIANLIQLAIATGCGAILLASGNDFVPDFACGAAGLFGGAVMQLLTLDERKRPSWVLLLGEILASATMGWGTYVVSGYAEDIKIRVCVLAAIAAGATGSMGFRWLIKLFRPKWLDITEGKK